MIEYKGVSYPTRHIRVHFKEDDYTQDIIVSTEDFSQALKADVDESDVTAMNIDNEIYFFLLPEDFFKAEITELDQPIELLEEDASHMIEAIVEQMNDWNLEELFQYHIDQGMLSEDEEFCDYLSSRPDLLDESKDHRQELLEGMNTQEILDRYKKLF